ncbi:kinase-like protein [Hortaea werneckii]|nr:kinase-like protein [Hortaea werneckii]
MLLVSFPLVFIFFSFSANCSNGFYFTSAPFLPAPDLLSPPDLPLFFLLSFFLCVCVCVYVCVCESVKKGRGEEEEEEEGAEKEFFPPLSPSPPLPPVLPYAAAPASSQDKSPENPLPPYFATILPASFAGRCFSCLVAWSGDGRVVVGFLTRPSKPSPLLIPHPHHSSQPRHPHCPDPSPSFPPPHHHHREQKKPKKPKVEKTADLLSGYCRDDSDYGRRSRTRSCRSGKWSRRDRRRRRWQGPSSGGGWGLGAAFPDFFQRDGHVGVDVLFRRAVGGGWEKIGGVGSVEPISRPTALGALAETDLDHFTVIGGHAVNETREGSFDSFGLIDLLGECSEDHAQLVEIRLDADTHADALAAVDQTTEFRWFPADWTSSPIDIDDPSIIILIDDDVREGEITLHKAGLVNIGKSLHDLLGPLLPSIPVESAVVVVENIDQGSSRRIRNQQAFDRIAAIVSHKPLKLDDTLTSAVNLVHEAGQMRNKVHLALSEARDLDMVKEGDRRVINHLISVLSDMDMQLAVLGCRLKLQIRNGVIELDIRQRLPDSLVNAERFVTLASPLGGRFGICDKELLPVGFVAESYSINFFVVGVVIIVQSVDNRLRDVKGWEVVRVTRWFLGFYICRCVVLWWRTCTQSSSSFATQLFVLKGLWTWEGRYDSPSGSALLLSSQYPSRRIASETACELGPGPTLALV